jgi:sugar lactone lactonase YvrE
MKFLTLAITFAILASSLTFADDVTDSRRLAREAVEAYKAKNLALFLEKSRAASSLRPSHPTMLYNYGAALALNGRGDEALEALERVAAMGMIYEPAKDDDFASIRESPRFARVVEALQRNADPTTKTKREFTIDDRGIISEGIAYDARTRRFFVSSVRNGAIYARDSRGKVSQFVRDQPWGVFGMAADPARRRLWAGTSALPQSKGFREDDRNHAAVLEIDLDSGRVLNTIRPQDDAKHVFGDVAVARDGSVFVSDSVSPSIYVIRGGAMTPLIRSGPFSSLQGLAPSSDGRILYAADYARGIFAIDVATGDTHLLPIPPNTSLLGVDGLYTAGKGTLVGTQNGTNPQRVIRMQLAPNGQAITRVDALASNERDFDDITLGVVNGGRLYFNAAAQWNLFGDDGTAPDAAKLNPARILSVSIR